MLQYFKRELTKRTGKYYGAYKSVLVQAFGNSSNTGTILEFPVPGYPDQESPKLRLVDNLRNASTPEFCALLAALDIPFLTATNQFADVSLRIEGNGVNAGIAGVGLESISIESAREALAAENMDTTDRLPKAKWKYFWFLRIRGDSEWLETKFSGTRFKPIPSISADRKSITGFMKRSDYLRKLLILFPPAIRARLRDLDWYSAKVLSQVRIREKIRRNQSDARLKDRRRSIKLALRSVAEDDTAVPHRITRAEIANLVGLSSGQVAVTLNVSPSLRRFVKRLNSQVIREKLLFAARELNAEGVPLTVKSVCKRAKVAAYHHLNSLVSGVIREVLDASS